MIWTFTGKTGSGKTKQMIDLAYKRWKNGTDIYSNTILMFCNYNLDIETKPTIINYPDLFNYLEKLIWYIKKLIKKTDNPPCRGRIVYFQDITEILEKKDGLILFDEAQTLFNARSWDNLPKEFQYKLQQSRKHKLDLFCTTQNMGTIDITYRRLVQMWIHSENLFQIGKSPRIFLGIFRRNIKDIDELYNSVDDLKTPTIKSNLFFIHRFTPILYDTMYDIGFKRFKCIWITTMNEQMKLKKAWFILPKEMSLSEGLKAIRLLNSACEPNKSPYSRKT